MAQATTMLAIVMELALSALPKTPIAEVATLERSSRRARGNPAARPLALPVSAVRADANTRLPGGEYAANYNRWYSRTPDRRDNCPLAAW